MHFHTSQGLRVVSHQTCVVFDKKTGKVAHIHNSFTFEGGEVPSKKDFESRAIELARQFAAQRTGIKLDRLEILHVRPEELEHVLAPKVDVKARRLVQGDAIPSLLTPKKKRAAARKPKPKGARKRK
jgi:hypothetical protein